MAFTNAKWYSNGNIKLATVKTRKIIRMKTKKGNFR